MTKLVRISRNEGQAFRDPWPESAQDTTGSSDRWGGASVFGTAGLGCVQDREQPQERRGVVPMADSDICFMTAVEMAGRIRNKELSAREALDAHLRQIERVNPKVNAIVTLVADQAQERARWADETIA